MNLNEDLTWRGLIKDKTFADDTWLNKPGTFYFGVDAGSADSLTIGNLAPILLARRLTEAGWKAVLLVGGATSLIGDPGGKLEERELTSREEVEKNANAIKGQIKQLFASQEFIPADNYDWFKDLGYLEFLRDVGKYFSMTELMQRDFVSDRMNEGGSGISYAEFSYSLIQGYDYWKLNKDHGVTLQIGGSDQWGNMLSGVSLIRKKSNAEVQALSMPLVVNKATGRKFGKSEEGNIWLDDKKTSITQFRQFWINTDDSDVEHFLKVFTLVPKELIDKVISEHKAKPELRIAQNFLADEVTKIVHGADITTDTSAVQKLLSDPNLLKGASDEFITQVRNELPSLRNPEKLSIITTVVKTGLASSNTEARRLLSSNAIYINGQAISRELFEPNDFIDGRLLLRRGKAFKDSALVELG